MGLNAPYFKLAKLPPDRDNVETIAVLRKTAKASAALAELKGVAKIIPNQEMLVNAIVLREAKDSSEIENIITTQDQLYRALAVNKRHISPEVKEVVNYRTAIFQGFNIIDKNNFLRVNDIIEINRVLIGNNAGVRKTPGTVLKNDRTGEVVYTPPQDVNEILELLSNFIHHFNGEPFISPLVDMAILHYQFESIHPFYDGNGRTGRILNILYLILNKLIDVPILYLSSFIIENKTDYYHLLNKVNKENDWEDWILFMLDAIEQTSVHAIKQIVNVKNQLDRTADYVRERAPKIYKKELVELIFEQPYSKIEFVTDKLGVERKAASRYLRELEKLEILELQKVGRENLYVNTGLIQILKE